MDIYEKLAQQWDTKRNSFPFSVPLPHGKPYWWKCDINHSWQATITNRKQHGCPVCAGKIIVPGINDLASNYPELAKEWHFTRNDKTPETTSKKSSKSVWWLGECGHEWSTKILHRANGSGCPFCTKHKVLPGFNDLKTTHPELYSQLHPTKNKGLDISVLTSGSSKFVWWLGECGHEWKARILNRAKSRTGCHECSSFNKTLDNSNVAIEYPHLLKQWSAKNSSKLEEYVSTSPALAIWHCEKGHEWEQSIKAKVRSTNPCVVCTGHQLVIGMNDFKSQQPELLKEWHPTKNIISPDEVTFSSGRKVWWLGKCGHEWEAKVSNRNNGASCSVCRYKKGAATKSSVKPGVNDLVTQRPAVASEWHPTKNAPLTPDNVKYNIKRRVWWQCAKGHEWETRIEYRTNKGATGCPRCAATTFSSRGEKMIYDFIKGLFPDAEANVRSVLDNNQELDIWVPGKNFAVEFNGLFWHDEHHKDRNYHFDKWLACKEKGVQLVQVWEDDWESRPDIVKSMLSHKLGVSSRGKVYARNTEVVEISQVRMNEFLNANHIQGANDGSVRVALIKREKDLLVSSGSGALWDEPEILAVMLLKREPGAENTLNLVRFATSVSVVGGFTKLLKHVESVYSPGKIITFSDNTVSDGGLYENNGFVAEFQLKPDYMYVVKNKRVHKFNYRLKRFREDPELLWDEKLTERELALLNNLPRIWDAGKTRWVKTY